MVKTHGLTHISLAVGDPESRRSFARSSGVIPRLPDSMISYLRPFGVPGQRMWERPNGRKREIGAHKRHPRASAHVSSQGNLRSLR